MDSKIDDLPRGSLERKTLERFFHGQSIPTSIDETGRLVLSSKLRERFAIGKEAYFIAAGDTFQIWSPQMFEADRSGVAGCALGRRRVSRPRADVLGFGAQPFGIEPGI